MSWRRLACAWYLGMGLFGPTALAATLPTGYRIDAAGYPWTGRLHAITFHMAPLTSPVQSVLSMWEAGRLLDRRDTASRRLYLGGAALGALHWHAIDAAARDTLAVEGNGPQRLAWLRGRLGDAGMRPRDTRLGSASGARVLVIPPPTWQPLQPGHDRFRQAHARRPHTVWLATRDGFVHGFESATGQELMAFLPRALLARAGDFSVHRPQGSGQMPDLPCARPDTIDADVGGRWRTLLLCAIPATGMEAAAIDGDADASGATGRTGRTGASGASGARGAGGASGAATLFALDVSDPTGDIPLPWHWEISGHAALPLTGTGPLRVAAVFEAGVRRWYAVAIVADALHTGMVLLPLGRPPSADVQSSHLPRGCGNTPHADVCLRPPCTPMRAALPPRSMPPIHRGNCGGSPSMPGPRRSACIDCAVRRRAARRRPSSCRASAARWWLSPAAARSPRSARRARPHIDPSATARRWRPPAREPSIRLGLDVDAAERWRAVRSMAAGRPGPSRLYLHRRGWPPTQLPARCPSR